MKPDHPLTDEQHAALAPSIRLIEAGPGAGKTKTVVARFRQQASTGVGVALLSFTNAAVDTARQRCRDTPTLLSAPNFIGTFDQFLHRYILTPALRQSGGNAPRYTTSWDDLPEHLSSVRPPNGGVAYPLTSFDTTDHQTWTLDADRLRYSLQGSWEQLGAYTRSQVNTAATKRIHGFHAASLFDCIEGRRRSLSLLTDAQGPGRLARLAARFNEVIVDEFQDCDQIEHQLLNLMHDAGIRTVAVADPDQAIFEFRQTRTDSYETFRATLSNHEIAPLTTCFRSAPSICAITTSLRKVGDHPVVAHETNTGSPHVHVVVGNGVKAGQQALKIVRLAGITGGETRVIAHSRSDARALTRAGKQPPNKTSNMEPLLVALTELRSRGDARIRQHAIRRIEKVLLSFFEWPDQDGALTRPEQLDMLGVGNDQLRILVSRLLTESGTWTNKKDCSSTVRALVERFAATTPVNLRDRIGTRCQVTDTVWAYWQSHAEPDLIATSTETIRWGHIHGVKGAEFDAVVVALPPRARQGHHVLDDWQTNVNSEQRRVLYVGVSRARKILVLVTPKPRSAQLLQILEDADVPHTVSIAT